MFKTTLLFFATALCEILGCYLPRLWLKRGATPLLLIPAGLALMMFVWLLTLHPAASGRGMPLTAACMSAPRCCGCVLSMALSLAIMTGRGADCAVRHVDYCRWLGTRLTRVVKSTQTAISLMFIR